MGRFLRHRSGRAESYSQDINRGEVKMANSYINCLVHVVFSTKGRRRELSPQVRDRLWPYLGGLARERGLKALCVGGTEDHVHLLLSFPSTISIADAMKELKAHSSRWIKETFPEMNGFSWQEGYGAFTVGASQKKKTLEYISGQEEHHKKRTFKEEFIAFLQKNDIDYDERYLWG